MGHGHDHGRPARSSPRVRRRLLAAVSPFLMATAIGLALLWPGSAGGDADLVRGVVPERHAATVVATRRGGCATPPAPGFTCSVVTVRLDGGPDAGETFSFDAADTPGARRLASGDPIVVARSTEPGAERDYFFVDYRRDRPLLLLGAIFVAFVLALSRWRGLASLVGLGVSLVVLVRFVIPAIVEGSNPLFVAIVGSAVVMFVTLYLAHGLNARTTSAVLGTLASLALTGALAVAFVELARFTGFASEEASFLQVSAQQVNLEGLLLGGIVIGTLGVLDDVTVTQAAAVWELHLANPSLYVRDLYRAALRIGRQHIASTVNTLVLAYAGASLPLLILFTLSARPVGDIVTTEVVATEIVRTLVGSIGLIAAVPITTALTSLVVAGGAGDRPRAGRSRDRPRARRTKFEDDWFGAAGNGPERPPAV